MSRGVVDEYQGRHVKHDPTRKAAAMAALDGRLPRADAGVALAITILGLTSAMRSRTITVTDAEEQVFNLDVLFAAEKLRTDPRLVEAIHWGLQLDDVLFVAPHGMDESYDAIDRLCRAVLADARPPAVAA